MSESDDSSFLKKLYKTFNFDLKALSFENIFSFLAAGGIIFGGVIPYIPQYREIHKTRNADGFSIYVCLVLLVANTLRIIFWFGHRFDFALLAQSIVMIITMFAMIELCVRIKNRNQISEPLPRNRMFFDSFDESRECLTTPNQIKLVSKHFYDLQLKYFWQWTDFVSYLECMSLFALISGILMYFLMDQPIFVQGVGFVALLTEAGLGLPQLYRNYVNKSTVGMNISMVFLWLAGDVFKTIYYVLTNSPIQFWCCGFIQITIDLLILMQGFFFKSQKKYKKIDKDYK